MILRLLALNYLLYQGALFAGQFTPRPARNGPYEDPIGGGMSAPAHLERKYQCTAFDPEDCELS